MLGSLGAGLSLFSAIRMQKARGFLFVLKIQTLQKDRTALFNEESGCIKCGHEAMVE
jgi:hypothetical protein